jgi:CO/xanthine dehydrogenase Mo-binding subunit
MTTRRQFLQLTAAAGGGLVLGFRLGPAEAASASGAAADWKPNAWLRIQPDGRVVVVVGKSEMGQGVRTALPMIVAEELDADLDRVLLEQASPGPDYEDLGTGGSSSITDSWDDLRRAAATAKEMLVAAAALRWGIAPALCRTEHGQVLETSGGRALSYGELASQAARQPVPAEPRLKRKQEFRLLGTAIRRLDGPDLVRGKARFGMDVRLPGMLYAAVARPPVLGGSLRSFDAKEALKLPGVRTALPITRGVAVVAESTWAALRARDALEIEWNDGPHAAFSSARHFERLVAAAKEPGITTRRDGVGRQGFASAATTLDEVYVYPFAAHASIEPVNCTAWFHDGTCEIWAPTQTPNGAQRSVAAALGIDPSKVTVNVTLLGGGFGRRLGWEFNVEAAEIASQAGAPVQLVWTRADDLKHGYFQAAAVDRLRAGLDSSGLLIAWEHRKVSTPHNARRQPSPEDLKNSEWLRGISWGVTDNPYAIPALETTYTVAEIPVPIGPWRAVFSPSSVFARECFVDEIAQRLERDPLALRLDLLGANDPSVPALVEPGGNRVDRRRLRKVLELATERAGWAASAGSAPAGRARGLACNVFHTETYVAYAVEVSLDLKAPANRLPFRVERVVCGLDCGVVVNLDGVRQQVESGVLWSLANMKSEITFENGRPQQSNFHDFRLLTIDETPRVIETHLAPNDDERPHGLGEPVVCPLAPAVANALSRLAGRRIRKLPVRAADLA